MRPWIRVQLTNLVRTGVEVEGEWQESTRVPTCVVLKIAPRRGGKHAVCVGTAHDLWMWMSSEDWTCCVREPVGECHPLAMIAYSENRPKWHNERRQAKVNMRPRSSPRPRTSHVVVHSSSGKYQASHGKPWVSQASTSILWIERGGAVVVVVFLFVGFQSFHLHIHCFNLAQENKSSVSLPHFQGRRHLQPEFVSKEVTSCTSNKCVVTEHFSFTQAAGVSRSLLLTFLSEHLSKGQARKPPTQRTKHRGGADGVQMACTIFVHTHLIPRPRAVHMYNFGSKTWRLQRDWPPEFCCSFFRRYCRCTS